MAYKREWRNLLKSFQSFQHDWTEMKADHRGDLQLAREIAEVLYGPL